MEPEIKLIIGLIIAVLIFCFFGIRSDMKRQHWLDAHCNVIGSISDSVGTGTVYTNNGIGVGTTYIPGKTGYQCDNGKQYWE